MKNKEHVTDGLSDGFFTRVLTSYDKIEDSYDGGLLYGTFSKLSTSKPVMRVRRAASRSMEQSVILRFFRSAILSLPWQTVRTYGVFLLSFGLYAAIIFAIKAVATTISADIDDLITGVLAVIVSIPLLTSGKSLSAAVCASRFVSYIAFDMLGFRRQDAAVDRHTRQRLDLSFLFGMICGLFTFYFPAGVILLFIISVLAAAVVMAKPETGVLLIFALFPFFSDRSLEVFIVITALSYFFKFICGRRTFRLGAAETLVLMFFLLLALGEVIHYGAGAGYSGDAGRIIYMIMYFLTVCLFSNASWRPRLIRALLFGGSAVATVSILSLFGETVKTVMSNASSAELAGLIAWCGNVFDSASVSTYYLAMIIPVMIAYVMRRGTGGKRFNMVVFSVLVVAAAIMTMSRGLWAGVLAGIAVMLIMIDARFAALPLFLAAATSLLMTVLPRSISRNFDALFDVSGLATQSRANIRMTSWRLFGENLLGGIGSADGVFGAVYDNATSVGAAATNAQSLYIQIGVELGITGLICFLFAAVLIVMKTVSGARYGVSSEKKLCSGALAAGMCAALFSGLSNCIWVDGRMFLLFWMFAGAASVYPMRGEVRREPEVTVTKITGDKDAAYADITIRQRRGTDT